MILMNGSLLQKNPIVQKDTTISLFELFSIGIGPSSSHTVGPMKAAYQFVCDLEAHASFSATCQISVKVYGSLAMTGHGHATDTALCLGLMGYTPEFVEPEIIPSLLDEMRRSKTINLMDKKIIPFNEKKNIDFRFGEFLDFHPNAMQFLAYNNQTTLLFEQTYYSIGGGFIIEHNASQQNANQQNQQTPQDKKHLPYHFNNAADLINLCKQNNMSISDLMLANEQTHMPLQDILTKIDHIDYTMYQCITNGLSKSGNLPGELSLRRRAKEMAAQLQSATKNNSNDNPLYILDWVNVFALAVNEENAAGGRIVTAPTNGAAGIIPAVLNYYKRFIPGANQEGIRTFLLTAGAIGLLYKKNASISAAEVGCQGEIGVACSMAAAGLAAVLNGTNKQIENAAEIGMEHNLGLTCDPVKGLVQIPCIERNTMGAVKAINAAQLAISGDGKHYISLDQVIETMIRTGKDMHSKYKETSTGGLAVNFTAC